MANRCQCYQLIRMHFVCICRNSMIAQHRTYNRMLSVRFCNPIYFKRSDCFVANSAASDTWCIQTSPVWIDMIGDTSTHYARPMPLMSDVAWKVWALPGMQHGVARAPELHLIAEPQSSIRIAIDHYQYIQLMRVVDTISKWLDTIDADRQFFAQTTRSAASLSTVSMAIVCIADRIQLNLLLPVDAPPSPYAASVASPSTSSIDVNRIVGMYVIIFHYRNVCGFDFAICVLLSHLCVDSSLQETIDTFSKLCFTHNHECERD